MSRAKSRRPGTRSGKQRAESVGPTDAFAIKKTNQIPEDLADAAEAALDDLLSGGAPDRSGSFSIDLEDTGFDPTDRIVAPPEPPAPPPAKRPPRAATARPRSKTRPPPPKSDDGGDAALDAPALPGGAAPPYGGAEWLASPVFEETSLAELPQLRFAVYEQADHLASCVAAIVAAGHLVVVGASGTSGLSKVADEIVAGIDVVVVALPGGEPVVDIAIAQEPRRPIVIAAVSGKVSDGCARAVAAGADLATNRPHDIERMAPMILAASRLTEERRLARNARGNEAVLRAKIEELSDPDIRGLQPFETFQRVLELELKRAKRFEYPLSVALFAVEVTPPPPPAGIRGILRARAGNALVQTIRDIDLATQLDHERFLVLLPYTDLIGATGLGRRVIAAVAKGDPVVSGGRSFPPRVVGAVAGARPGQELSFSRLMKEATQALAQARKDGAELAVQPTI
jgi:two-component system, cell cycle response regulator